MIVVNPWRNKRDIGMPWVQDVPQHVHCVQCVYRAYAVAHEADMLYSESFEESRDSLEPDIDAYVQAHWC